MEQRITEARNSHRSTARDSILPPEPQLYTNSARDLEEKARREAEEEKRRQAREEAKFKEHMERRKLAMVDSILAEAGGTPLLDTGTAKPPACLLPAHPPCLQPSSRSPTLPGTSTCARSSSRSVSA